MENQVQVMVVPKGCCENVDNGLGNCIKVMKKVLEFIPKSHKIINVLFNGTGFSKYGEIYLKNKDYVYIYLY